MRLRLRLVVPLLLFAVSASGIPAAPVTGQVAPAGDWVAALGREITAIDASTPGAMGVFVKHLEDERTLSHQADRLWYLSSTVKVPVAIAVLRRVEAGDFTLDHELVLKESDYVDGAGDLQLQEPGRSISVRVLIQKMLTNSDSTATDMLIRLIGEDRLNAQLRALFPDGFGTLTTILQVRYDAYGLLHPSVQALDNQDFIDIKRAKPGNPRLRALLSKLPVDRADLNVKSIDEAFERYYQLGLNSAKLTTFGSMLERLVRGELLSPSHTRLVLDSMERITTGQRRIQASLPDGIEFAQKTGTQVRRVCNMGAMRRNGARIYFLVVSACVEKAGIPQAEAALRRLGEAMRRAGLY
jgi:beta-lactamase class A